MHRPAHRSIKLVSREMYRSAYNLNMISIRGSKRLFGAGPFHCEESAFKFNGKAVDARTSYHNNISNYTTVFGIKNSIWNPHLRLVTMQCRANGTTSPSNETMQFLLSLGYSEEVSNGIIEALLENGIPQSSLFNMVKGLAGRYEVGEDGGLEALAVSVKIELEKKLGKATVKIWCLPSTSWSSANDADGLPVVHSMERAFAIEALEGVTLTDIVNDGTSENCDVLGEYLECACSGIMACSTCHVVIHPDWYDKRTEGSGSDDLRPNHSIDPKKVGPPSEAELDMIDLAYEPQLTSRLGCQIKVTKELDGLVVLLPAQSNNLMDFVPFE